MPDARDLRRATQDEIADTLSFELRFEGRKRVPHAEDALARMTAVRPVRIWSGPVSC
jgi:hypothetical protein